MTSDKIKNDKCKKVRHIKFLFWKWDSITFEHVWTYTKDHKERRCIYCNRKEFLWGIERNWDIVYEDWRLLSNKDNK